MSRIKLICPECESKLLEMILPFKCVKGKKVIRCLSCNTDNIETKWKKIEEKDVIYD